MEDILKKYDKRLLAADMLTEAVSKFINAQNEFDYVQSILLSGACIGITDPLLREVGKKTSHEKSAEIVIELRKHRLQRELTDEERKSVFTGALRFNKAAYNSLKHSGFRDQVAASDDLEIETDFKLEAEELIWAAIGNFNQLPLPYEFLHSNGKSDLIEILGSLDPLGNLPTFDCKAP